MMPTICILGDHDPAMPTHRALEAARNHAAAALSRPVSFEWVATDALNLDDLGTRFQGLWVAPGSPYRDEARVLRALTRARESDLPSFGNCGGFQFMVLEFARNVAGVTGARHAESEKVEGDNGPTVVSPLACSLKGLTETLMVIPATKLAGLVGSGSIVGRYFCSYGVNSAFGPPLERAGLVWTSFNAEGEPRSFELPSQRFYLGCLFQPALDSEAGRPNPVIVGFLNEVAL
jgi:CTP synthase (UTP-ammonia lyase)